jgi:hypothetical protein
MNTEPQSIYRPTRPVPVRWYLAGCAVIFGVAAVFALKTSTGVMMILSVGGCAAWWFIFLIIVEKDYRNWSIWRFFESSNEYSWGDRRECIGSSFEPNGPSNVNGLPTDEMGIDTVGNVFGTGGSDDNSSRF